MRSNLTLKMILLASGFTESMLKNTIAIRHNLTQEEVKLAYNSDSFNEFQSIQKQSMLKDKEYAVVFVGGKFQDSKFIGIYKVSKPAPVEVQKFQNKPWWEEKFSSMSFFNFELTDYLKDLRNLLFINWGNFIKNWYFSFDNDDFLNDKNVISISTPIPFLGFEKVKLSFEELNKIVRYGYQDWKQPLSDIFAVYQIESPDGHKYIGSAYGENGLWGRWSSYVDSKYGSGGKKLKELIEKQPELKESFTFSILFTCPKTEKETVCNKEKELIKELKIQDPEHCLN